MKKPPQKVVYLLGVFFSAALTAKNSPELHFCFLNSFIQPSRVRSLIALYVLNNEKELPNNDSSSSAQSQKNSGNSVSIRKLNGKVEILWKFSTMIQTNHELQEFYFGNQSYSQISFLKINSIHRFLDTSCPWTTEA